MRRRRVGRALARRCGATSPATKATKVRRCTVSEPTRFCPACYTSNDWQADRCLACGAKLQTDESYDERLIWALDHPDTATAMLAAQVLADRRASAAIDSLIRLIGSRDPYRAAGAARALLAFEDDDRARLAIEAAREHGSALVRAAVVYREGRGEPDLTNRRGG